MTEVYVGLDYHQKTVQVCVMDPGGVELANRSCPNEWGSIVSYAERFGRVRRAAIESCCGAADLAEELVTKAGWSVEMAHPGYLRRMKQSPDKSDYSDAKMTADLTRVGYLPKVWLAPQPIRELRRLIRHRQSIADQRRNAKLRIRSLLREQRLRCSARAWTRPWLQWLEHEAPLSEQGRWVIERLLEELSWLQQRIAEAEKHLTVVTADDVVVAKLLEQPGVGPVTAWTIRAEIGRFDRFVTGKQLSRFCSLSPRNASSGERLADAGLIRAGSARLRAVLIEAAHRLTLRDPRWRAFSLKLRESGKPGSVVAAAVANRWIRGLFYEMRKMA